LANKEVPCKNATAHVQKFVMLEDVMHHVDNIRMHDMAERRIAYVN